jgi:hypothetical protein
VSGPEYRTHSRATETFHNRRHKDALNRCWPQTRAGIVSWALAERQCAGLTSKELLESIYSIVLPCWLLYSQQAGLSFCIIKPPSSSFSTDSSSQAWKRDPLCRPGRSLDTCARPNTVILPSSAAKRRQWWECNDLAALFDFAKTLRVYMNVDYLKIYDDYQIWALQG